MAGFLDSIKRKFQDTANPNKSVGKSFSQHGLWHAVKEKKFDTVKQLVKKNKKDINAYNFMGETAFHTAVRTGSLPMVQLVIELGADPHLPIKGASAYSSPVHLAVAESHPQLIPFLKSIGFSLSAPASNGWTPLRQAAAEDKGEMVRALLEAGADPDVKLPGGRLSAETAVNENKVAAVEAFVKSMRAAKGLCHTAYRNNKDDSPVFRALSRGFSEAPIVLFENGLSLNCRDGGGRTPLHYAVRNQDEKLLSYLLQKGADINRAFDNEGRTPFHLLCDKAGEMDEAFVARAYGLLTLYGADPTLNTAYGRPAKSLIKDCPALVNLVESYGKPKASGPNPKK